MTELKVSAFASDLGADQDSGTITLCKPGCIAVPLHQGHGFIKPGRINGNMGLDPPVNGLGRFRRGADDQDFFRLDVLCQLSQVNDQLLPHEKKVTTLSALFGDLPATSGWVLCESNQPLAGFELMGDSSLNTMAAVSAQ